MFRVSIIYAVSGIVLEVDEISIVIPIDGENEFAYFNFVCHFDSFYSFLAIYSLTVFLSLMSAVDLKGILSVGCLALDSLFLQ